MNKKDKFISFIKFVQTNMISIPCLVQEYDNFMESDFKNAKEYFTSIGMVNTKHIEPSDVEICKVLMNIFLYDNEIQKMTGDVSQYVIGKAIKHFSGRVDPKRIKEISVELTK